MSSILVAGLMLALLASTAFAGGDDSAIAVPPVTCANGVPGGVSCITSKKDLKEARTAYSHGLKLQDHQRFDEAFAQFDEAARLAPQDPQFITAREIVKAQLVFDHVERGNALLTENEQPRAVAEFRAALDLDPDNQFARERLAEATRDAAPTLNEGVPTLLSDSGEIRLQPRNERATFHFRGEARGLFTELAAAYGVTAQFDDSVTTRQVRFNVDNVDFATALRLACQVSKTMWTALDARQLLVAADTPENHRQFDHM